MSSSSSRKIAAANGFGRGSLTVKEAWALYHARYPVPPDMRLPSSGGWKMAMNGIGIPPPPTPGTERWKDAIRAQRAELTDQEQADPTWAAKNNDDGWATYFKAKYDVEMRSTTGLIGGPNSWKREGRALFWGVPGRTHDNVIRDGAPRLEAPPSLPPSPAAQWQPRRTTYSSSSNSSSSSGLARSKPCSYRATPYSVTKQGERGARVRDAARDSEARRQQQRHAGDALLVPKPEVKEEHDDEEAAKAA
jgi:hypothetical protein